jgi:hypothetical protein
VDTPPSHGRIDIAQSGERGIAVAENPAALVMNRYQDAYRVGNSVVGTGNAIKTVGILFGGLIGLVSLSAASSVGASAFVVGALVGGVVCLLFWSYGVTVAAQGQMLLATLDSAVSSSPFLTNDERATVMGIR